MPQKIKKIQFQFSEVLKYDWLDTISWEKQLYNVYGSEGILDLHGNKIPAIIFRLTSDNPGRDWYAVIGRINPVSNYWSDLPYAILRIIENEFMPKYKKN